MLRFPPTADIIVDVVVGPSANACMFGTGIFYEKKGREKIEKKKKKKKKKKRRPILPGAALHRSFE